MSAAYWINNEPADAARFYAVACNPQRSVVVEACAGAGKTWMLVSRIVRALLDGCAPQEVLAITFTRKAAAEMRERLSTWLREFAAAEPAQRVAELMQRGLTQQQAQEAQAALGALRGTVLEAARSVGVHTFHGWFWQLIRSAPMDLLLELGLSADMQLLEDNAEILPDAWRRFMQAVARDADLTADYTAAVADLGRHSARKWLESALNRRTEFELADAAGVLDTSVPPAAQWQPRLAGLPTPHAAWHEPAVQEALRTVVRDWDRHKNKMPREAALELDAALAESDPAAAHARIAAALFTQSMTLRARLPEHPSLALMVETMQAIEAHADQQRAHELHMRMVRLTRALIAAYRQIKFERALADMADLERAALHLLRDASLAAWMQERLDARVRHLLIDEFQDTSPLQWQALQAWLAGYAGAGGGASGQRPPAVFIVGDPKQSIYRFRRAEPRVFLAAQQFVVQGLGGDLLACDHTRRNGQAVLDVLNASFAAAQAAGDYTGFRAHTTAAEAAGAVRVLPQIPREPKAEGRHAEAWRDSLNEPRVLAEEAMRLKEGRQVALAVAELLAQGYLPGEVYILARKRESLRWAAEALREQGIAHAAPEEQALSDSPVARDLIAVLEAIVSPDQDLSLAHALRSPLFGAADEDLIALKQRALHGGCSWWQALAAWADTDADPAPASLQRARGLLLQWQPAQHKLPPHDLLARVVTDGDLRVRLAALLPRARRAAALAHVDAVLAQALALDAGRYATPYNFVRALKRRPIQLASPQQPEAVQMLTVHGAKGLEARAVFIVDADPGPSRSDSHTMLIDWQVGSEHPELCAFLRSESAPPPSLRDMMGAEQLARQREELNALYVAVTRARELLVLSRHQPHRRGEANWWQRLEVALAASAAEWHVHTASRPEPAQPQTDAGYALRVLPPYATVPRVPPGASDQAADQAVDTALAALGQAVHLAMQWLTQPWGQGGPRLQRAQVVAAACTRLGLDAPAAAEVERVVGRMLGSAELRTLLDSSRALWAGNEVELQFEGELLRLDRVVHLPDATDATDATAPGTWWVLDYKLDPHPEDQPAYRAQLSRYARAVLAAQPEARVRAAFITGEGRLVEMP